MNTIPKKYVESLKCPSHAQETNQEWNTIFEILRLIDKTTSILFMVISSPWRTLSIILTIWTPHFNLFSYGLRM